MTARLYVTPKATEHNRIVCTSESEAEVTDNKKLRSRYCTIDATKLTTDRHKASRGLFATAQLGLLLYIYACTVRSWQPKHESKRRRNRCMKHGMQ